MPKGMTATSLVGLALLASSCSPLQVEHKVEPIHVTIDVYHRVDERLDEFFEFEEEVPSATQPATQPVVQPATQPPTPTVTAPE